MTKPNAPIDAIVHSTVRIESVNTTGASSSGTGFFFNFLDNGKTCIPAIVTNKHVIEGSKTGYFNLTTKKSDGSPDLGNHIRLQMDNFELSWIKHPDPNIDLAICPIAPVLNQAKSQNLDFFYQALVPGLIPTDEILSSLSAMEEVIMVGYPNGIWDSKHNLPVLRRGITATHPKIDLNGKTEFLIDAACFPGSSGSPVILYNNGSYPTKNGIAIGTRIIFLGVLYAGPMYTAQGEIIVAQVPTGNKPLALSNIPTNLGIVTKSSNLKVFDSILSNLSKPNIQ